ncbi:cation:proton antiporter [Actinoplanes sp. NPDC026619]|uniref:cation:proton antiporter n=1 Tax=Actinoplanes sp. NPDC026619 TaxID=3155798 RepID=UPI0033DF75C4
MPAPLAAHQSMLLLLQLGLLLVLVILLGRLAARFGLPAIVGELTAGVVLGPSLLGWAAPGVAQWLTPARPEQAHLLDAIGQIAVVLLVGLTGMEMDPSLLRRRRGTLLRVGLAGLIIPLGLGIALGYPAAALLRGPGADTHVFAMFLGVALCVTAIPVMAKILMDMNLMHRDIGQLALGVGVLDDAFGWFMLSIVSATAIEGLTPAVALMALASLALVVKLAWWPGRPIAKWALRRSKDSEERTVAVAVAMILLAAAGTQALGLEPVFGAFVCGVVIGSAARATGVRTSSLRVVVLSFLAPVFFATAGLRIDLRALGRPAVLLAAVLVIAVAVLGKFSGAYLGARLSRLNRWEALALGAGLNARGVIEIVVATVGLRLGILDAAGYTIVVLLAVVTSVMAPPLLRVAMRHVECTREEEMRLTAWSGTSARDAVPTGG